MMTVLWLPVALWFGLLDTVHWGWRNWAVLLASAIVHVAYFNVLLACDRLGIYDRHRRSGVYMDSHWGS
jgi:hypothetical protein